MPAASSLILFGLAALALLLVPGPSVLYIVTRSLDQGHKAGLVSVLGIHLGTMVHAAAAALGLSAVIASSAVAFTTIKIAGATYLIAIGILRLARPTEEKIRNGIPKSLRRIFVQGAVVNLLNPKTALFFLAFLPQFVEPSRGSVALQITIFGLLFIGLGILSDGTYALLASSAGSWLRKRRNFVRLHRWVAGSVYIGLGASALLAGSDTHS